MSEFLPRELAAVFMIGPVENDDMKIRIEAPDSGDVSNARARRSAVSAVTARFSATIALIRLAGTPSACARALALKLSGTSKMRRSPTLTA